MSTPAFTCDPAHRGGREGTLPRRRGAVSVHDVAGVPPTPDTVSEPQTTEPTTVPASLVVHHRHRSPVPEDAAALFHRRSGFAAEFEALPPLPPPAMSYDTSVGADVDDLALVRRAVP